MRVKVKEKKTMIRGKKWGKGIPVIKDRWGQGGTSTTEKQKDPQFCSRKTLKLPKN